MHRARKNTLEVERSTYRRQNPALLMYVLYKFLVLPNRFFPLKSNNSKYMRETHIEMESETGTKRREGLRERERPGEVERYSGAERQEEKDAFSRVSWLFCMATSGTQLCRLDAGGLRELASRYKSGINS